MCKKSLKESNVQNNEGPFCVKVSILCDFMSCVSDLPYAWLEHGALTEPHWQESRRLWIDATVELIESNRAFSASIDFPNPSIN